MSEFIFFDLTFDLSYCDVLRSFDCSIIRFYVFHNRKLKVLLDRAYTFYYISLFQAVLSGLVVTRPPNSIEYIEDNLADLKNLPYNQIKW